VIISPHASELELRRELGADAVVVIAFRRFLEAAGPGSGPVEPRRVRFEVPEPWLSYARGQLTAAQALELDDAARAYAELEAT
jgi:hypothetical protein